MTTQRVYHYPDNQLTWQADPVLTFDESVKACAQDLKDTAKLYEAEGLAATQVGSLYSMFVIKDGDDYLVACNPVVRSVGTEVVAASEGCLSFPGVHERIERYENVELVYQDELGVAHVRILTGMQSVAAQHEMDHLDGKTFLDRMGKVQKHLAIKKMNKTNRRMKHQMSNIMKAIKQSKKDLQK